MCCPYYLGPRYLISGRQCGSKLVVYHIHDEPVVADRLQVWHLKDDLVPTRAAAGDPGRERLVIFREDFPIRPWVVSPSQSDALFCDRLIPNYTKAQRVHKSIGPTVCRIRDARSLRSLPCSLARYGTSRRDVLSLAGVSHAMHRFCRSYQMCTHAVEKTCTAEGTLIFPPASPPTAKCIKTAQTCHPCRPTLLTL